MLAPSSTGGTREVDLHWYTTPHMLSLATVFLVVAGGLLALALLGLALDSSSAPRRRHRPSKALVAHFAQAVSRADFRAAERAAELAFRAAESRSGRGAEH